MSKGLKERVDREIHNFIIHEFLQNKPFMGVDHFVRNLLDTRSELSTAILTLIEQEKGMTPLEWFTTDNPLLGDVTPINMIRNNKGEKLCKWIDNQLKESEGKI